MKVIIVTDHLLFSVPWGYCQLCDTVCVVSKLRALDFKTSWKWNSVLIIQIRSHRSDKLNNWICMNLTYTLVEPINQWSFCHVSIHYIAATTTAATTATTTTTTTTTTAAQGPVISAHNDLRGTHQTDEFPAPNVEVETCMPTKERIVMCGQVESMLEI